MNHEKKQEEYQGYELGPIRPPSEATSLLLRITRNCPWNQCRFCTLYKGQSFRVRPKEHVMKDIDLIDRFIDSFKKTEDRQGAGRHFLLDELRNTFGLDHEGAYYVAMNWYRNGMESVFLQDANSLVMKPDDLVEILHYLRQKFPEIQRITSYARSHTVARISEENLQRIAEAGLNRIHIGMETGCDEVLDLIKKGVNKEAHIQAGQKLKKTSIQLSEYYMPGLGGTEYSRQNAIETADALNQINPDYIRIRTTAIPNHSLLYEDYQNGVFTRANDVQMVRELGWMIENLEGITSVVKSDHILNLLEEVEGKLPEDKEAMLSVIHWFLSLSPEEQMIFRIGRRTGVMNQRADLEHPGRRQRVQRIIEQNHVTADSLDEVTDELLKRFI